MTLPETVDEILDFAIAREEESSRFYTDLARKMEDSSMRGTFESFAGEEEKHKAKLEEIKSGRNFSFDPAKIMDLKIADYIVAEETGTGMDYQKALILAMNREKRAFRLYTRLSESATDENLKSVFEFLAREEARHKLRIELEYDEIILSED